MKKAFDPFADKDSRILILGTMPGEKSLELQQYYGHKSNQFWKILFSLFGKPFTTDYSERVALLHEKHIALWDVLYSCEGQGSADSAIRNEVPNDFEAFYAAYPQLKKVFFASRQAEKFYDKYVGRSADKVYHTLPSPSPAYAAMRFEDKLEKWRIITE